MSPHTSAERGREVRTKLLSAASELISERGWHAVSTRMLAGRAGVRSGLVHYHFASLNALLRQAAVDRIQQSLAAATGQIDQSDTLCEGVEQMLSYLDELTGHEQLSLLVAEANLAATRDEQFRTVIRQLVEEFRGNIIAKLTAEGHETPESAALALSSLLDGFAIQKALNPHLCATTIIPSVRSILAKERGAS